MKLQETVLKILKAKALWIFPLGLIYAYLDQKITQGMFDQMTSQEGLGFGIWVYAGSAIILGLIYPVLLISFMVAALVNNDMGQEHRIQWTQALKEQMRVTGSSLLWGLAFILPGIIRYFQLLFVPLIALADPKYQTGEIDALKTSQTLFRKNWPQVLWLVLLFVVILPLGLSSLDEQKIFSKSLWTAVPLSMLDTLLSIVFLSCLWNLFSKSLKFEEKKL